MEAVSFDLFRLDFLTDMPHHGCSKTGTAADGFKGLRHPPDIIHVDQRRLELVKQGLKLFDCQPSDERRKPFAPRREHHRMMQDAGLSHESRERPLKRTRDMRLPVGSAECPEYGKQITFGPAHGGDPMDIQEWSGH